MVGRTSVVRPRIELLAAVAAGVLATFVSAVLVEASTDRNWSLGGWDWPETLTTSIVLTLVALWFLPMVAARVAVRPRGPVRRLIKSEIEQRGYRVVPAPPLASTPEYALEPHFEYVLAHYLERRDDSRPFFFVQIGAFDGVVHDPLYEHVRDGHWHGVLVEPQKAPFENLRRNHAGADGLTFVNAAVDGRRGQRELFRLEDEDGEAIGSLSYLATFSPYRLEHWRNHDGAATRAEIGSVPVECVTFEDLLHDVTYLDLLHLDAEGYNLELLKLFDFSRCAPPIVRFEHAHLARSGWDEAVALLARHGYRLVAEEYDTTAYRPRHAAPVDVTTWRGSS